jgi:hydrogenase assembly chaperone HypC/HupF
MSAWKTASPEWLELPARVLRVRGSQATVDLWGARARVRLELLHRRVRAGDYVFIHAGYATRHLAGEDIQAAFELYDQLWRSEPEDETSTVFSSAEGLTGPTLSRRRGV